MAKPRVFISSTYYDLKHIRYSLDIFISTLGYETILSEKGDIAYSFDLPLDESCYKEVNNVDIFVLIIGGRYGSEVSSSHEKKQTNEFYDRYESITRKEFETAITKDIPIYILIESNVYGEYRTYQKNKDLESIAYAHVDSVNIFHFIEYIMSKPRNNPIKSFDKFDEIENWLKDQWAGLFKDLITRKVNQNQIRNLTSEISELQDINKTLKNYLEEILRSNKDLNSEQVIEKEEKRLTDSQINRIIEKNTWFNQCHRLNNIPKDVFLNSIKESNNLDEYLATFPIPLKDEITDLLYHVDDALSDLNQIRLALNLPQFERKISKN